MHQYGGNIRAKFKGSRSKAFEGSYLGKLAALALGARKPMRFYAGGHWWSKYTVRIPRTPMLPDPGELPADWKNALEQAAVKALERWASVCRARTIWSFHR